MIFSLIILFSNIAITIYFMHFIHKNGWILTTYFNKIMFYYIFPSSVGFNLFILYNMQTSMYYISISLYCLSIIVNIIKLIRITHSYTENHLSFSTLIYLTLLTLLYSFICSYIVLNHMYYMIGLIYVNRITSLISIYMGIVVILKSTHNANKLIKLSFLILGLVSIFLSFFDFFLLNFVINNLFTLYDLLSFLILSMMSVYILLAELFNNYHYLDNNNYLFEKDLNKFKSRFTLFKDNVEDKGKAKETSSGSNPIYRNLTLIPEKEALHNEKIQDLRKSYSKMAEEKYKQNMIYRSNPSLFLPTYDENIENMGKLLHERLEILCTRSRLQFDYLILTWKKFPEVRSQDSVFRYYNNDLKNLKVHLDHVEKDSQMSITALNVNNSLFAVHYKDYFIFLQKRAILMKRLIEIHQAIMVNQKTETDDVNFDMPNLPPKRFWDGKWKQLNNFTNSQEDYKCLMQEALKASSASENLPIRGRIATDLLGVASNYGYYLMKMNKYLELSKESNILEFHDYRELKHSLVEDIRLFSGYLQQVKNQIEEKFPNDINSFPETKNLVNEINLILRASVKVLNGHEEILKKAETEYTRKKIERESEILSLLKNKYSDKKFHAIFKENQEKNKNEKKS